MCQALSTALLKGHFTKFTGQSQFTRYSQSEIIVVVSLMSEKITQS